MGTEALIGLETNAGIAYRCIHLDGYPEGVGLELLAYKAQAAEIVMSDAERGSEWDSESPSGRILDLPDTRAPRRFPSRQAFWEFASGWVNFAYLWDGQQWLVADMVDDPVLRVLSSSSLDLSYTI